MMSMVNLKKYWPYKRVKIKNMWINEDSTITHLELHPDLSFLPLCSCCKKPVRRIHSQHSRIIRDLPMGQTITVIQLHYRKVICDECGIRNEYFDFLAPYSRVTKRFSQYIFNLCQQMTVYDVAKLVKLSWHQVKAIDRNELIRRHSKIDLSGLKILAIDETSFLKGHKYITVVANYQTGQVIAVIKNRDYEAIASFFSRLGNSILKNIEAVVMDMWPAYIKVVKVYCRNASIVFDKFHVIAAFNKTIDSIRQQEYLRASEKDKRVFRGSKYLFLRKYTALNKQEERPKLDAILQQNALLAKTYILKDYINTFWNYDTPRLAKEFILHWCKIAVETKCKKLIKFVNMIKKYLYGIVNHCVFQINNAKLEGINNKIKVIKRRAYGYLDYQYFGYKIMQATTN